VSEPVDMLFLGASIHAKDIDPSVKKFIEGLDPALVKHVTVFGTGFEGNKEMAVGIMKDLLAQRRIPVMSKHYFCLGKFLFFSFHHPNALAQRRIPVMSKHYFCLGKFLFFSFHHPNAQDLTGAEEFARNVLAG